MKTAPPGSPPSPRRLLPGQLMIEFLLDRLKATRRIHQECGGLAAFKLGPRRVYLVSHPDYVQEALVDKNDRFEKGVTLHTADRLIGQCLILSEGALHKQQRAIFEPALAHDHSIAFDEVIVNSFVDRDWQDGQVIDVHEEMRRTCLAVTGRILLGEALEHQTPVLSKAATEVMKGTDRLNLPIGPLLDKIPLPPTIRFRWALKVLDTLVWQLIHEVRRNDKGERRGLLVNVIRDKGPMSEQLLRDEVMLSIFALWVANATVLSWAWYLLSQNPHAEQRLHAEVDEVLDGRPPTASDLPRLRYTRWVASETMRIYPPIWILPRQFAQDVDIGGYTLRAGAEVLLPAYAVHRDGRYYPDPERFVPERWENLSDEPGASTYFPFGIGPRNCIGQPLSWIKLPLLLARIASSWQFRLAPTARVEEHPLLFLIPKYGLQMSAHRRR